MSLTTTLGHSDCDAENAATFGGPYRIGRNARWPNHRAVRSLGPHAADRPRCRLHRRHHRSVRWSGVRGWQEAHIREHPVVQCGEAATDQETELSRVSSHPRVARYRSPASKSFSSSNLKISAVLGTAEANVPRLGTTLRSGEPCRFPGTS